MTREEILGMSADQLAEATARHVMGWEWREPTITWNAVSSGYWWSLSLEEPVFDWNPSKDISAAWEAWDLGREDEHLIVECKDGEYCATIHRFKQGEESWDVDTWTYSAKTKEEAMMKCRLLAVLEG